MNIVSELFITAGLLSLAMGSPVAGVSVTREDCATVDYQKQADEYAQRMDAAKAARNQDLYAQARDAQKAAQANADACAAMTQSST